MESSAWIIKMQIEHHKPTGDVLITEKCLTLACLILWLIAGHTFASAGGQCPIAVTLAQKPGNFDLLRICHAHSVRCYDSGQLFSGWRLRIICKMACNVRTCDVEDLDSNDRETSTLISECKIDSLLGDGNASNLSVDDYLFEWIIKEWNN